MNITEDNKSGHDGGVFIAFFEGREYKFVMSRQKIINKIHEQENDIEFYYAEINKCEKKIEELEMLRGKYTSFQSNFFESIQRRKARLENMKLHSESAKIANRYYSGMSQLLQGIDLGNAYDGLDRAKTAIWNKILELDNYIETNKGKIVSANNRICSLREELRKLDREEHRNVRG